MCLIHRDPRLEHHDVMWQGYYWRCVDLTSTQISLCHEACLTDPLDSPPHANKLTVQPLGRFHFAKEAGEFKKNIDAVREGLKRYRQWCEHPQQATRLLTGLKVCVCAQAEVFSGASTLACFRSLQLCVLAPVLLRRYVLACFRGLQLCARACFLAYATLLPVHCE